MNLDLTPFEKALGRLQSRLSDLSKRMQQTGETLSQNLTLPILGVGAAAVKAFGDMERLENSLTAIMGSSEAAGAELERLRKVAEAPGLALPEVVKASASLQSVGFSANNARATIEQFGNAVATFGTGGAEAFDGVILALSQISAVGQVTQEDLNQIKERIPGFAQVMKQEFGVTTAEAIRELGISSEEFIARSVGALSKLERANGGISNAFANFKDNVTASLAVLGESIAKNLNLEQVLTKLSDTLARIVNVFKNLSPAMQKTVVIFAAILAAIGPVLFIVGKLAGAWGIMLTGFRSLISIGPKIGAAWAFITGPVGLTVAAIAGLIAILAILYTKFEGVRRVINGLGMAFIEIAKLAKESFTAILEGFSKLKDGDFKGAAQSFATGLKAFNPIEQGRVAALGFAKGFEDTTDYLTPAIEGIKKKVKEAQASFGLTTFTPTTPGGRPPGGGGGNVEPKIDTKALEAQEKAISNITSNIAKLAQTAKGSFGFVRAELSNITVLTPELNKQKDALLEYQKAILQVSNQAAIFGENPLNAQLSTTESALRSALEMFGPYSEAVRVLADEYDRLKNSIDQSNTATETAKEKQQKLGETISSIVSSIGTSFSDAISGAVSFGEAMRKVITDVIGLLIQELVITVVKNTANSPLGKALGPAILPIAAAAGAAAGQLAKSLLNRVKLAKGGLAFGETMAVVGDNPGARTDPEVIAPLSKLKDYLNPAGGAFVAEARISGTDLLILVNNADRANKRVR
jgi:tape measure domain-containing protein